MTILPEPPRAALVDPRTGGLTREWTRFFDELRKAIISSLDEGVAGRLDRLEMDTLFSVDDAGGGASGAGYNDTTVRARLEALETELLFLNGQPPPQDYETVQDSLGDWELDAAFNSLNDGAIQRLARDGAARDLLAATTPDHAGTIKRLGKAVADLELANALAMDASGQIAACAYRLNALETENLFKR